MECGVVGKRVNTSQYLQIFLKSATFFLVIFFSLGSVNTAFAESLPLSPTNIQKTITVSAVVPLSETFSFALAKNSIVTLSKKAPVLGEMVSVSVRLTADGKQFLSSHSVELSVVNSSHQTLLTLRKKTIDGGVEFTFKANTGLLGKNTIELRDVTYEVPILLRERATIIIYENEKELLKSQKIGKRGSFIVVAESARSGWEWRESTEKKFPNSGTMDEYWTSTMPARAGPPVAMERFGQARHTSLSYRVESAMRVTS